MTANLLNETQQDLLRRDIRDAFLTAMGEFSSVCNSFRRGFAADVGSVKDTTNNSIRAVQNSAEDALREVKNKHVAVLEEKRARDARPCMIFRPVLSKEARCYGANSSEITYVWVAIYGGVIGEGQSPRDAYIAFDKAWFTELPAPPVTE